MSRRSRPRRAPRSRASDGETFAVIAGGGTAGHLLPGLSVAATLVERGHPAHSIRFVGSARGPESRLVPAAGFEVALLPGRGLQRRLTLANLGSAWGILQAVVRAFRLVRELRPRVVLVLGGYASFAATVAAILNRAPIVVSEQNARSGAVSRVAARFAKACAVPFPETDLPRSVVTGNPVREAVRAIGDGEPSREEARAALGVPSGRILLAAFSGSLGSRRVNSAVGGAAKRWADRDDLAVYHVLGSRDWAERSVESDEAGEEDGLWYRVVEYQDDMNVLLAAADLAVCRAGGTTVAELTVAGLPSVLVPLPIATRDHQSANARSLVDGGAAVLVPDAELDVDRLLSEVEPLLADPSRLEAMAAAARSLARPDAAERIADLLEEHAR